MKESGGITKGLGGWNIALSRGYQRYQTTTVIYKLCGGHTAQQWFWDRQRKVLQSELGVNLSAFNFKEFKSQPVMDREGFSEVPPEKMPWVPEAFWGHSHNYCEYTSSPLQELTTHQFWPDPVIPVADSDNDKDLEGDLDSVENLLWQSADSHADDRPLCSPPPLSDSHENGDGNYQLIRQDAIQCMGCEKYSHVACLPYPYREQESESKLESSFICQRCTEGDFSRVKPTKESVGRLDLISKTRQHLRCGKSVLVADRSNWRYPARLVYPETTSKWKIKWWSGNQVSDDAKHTPGTYEVVPSSRIIDALYGDVKGRRSVRLGRWTTSPETLANGEKARQAQNDIVEDPGKSLPYTEEVHRVLLPHQNRLTHLIFNRSKLKSADFPTLAFLRRYHLTVVPYTGGLSPEVRSQIMNWIYKQIPGVREALPAWTTDGSLQDAFLLWIADRDQVKFMGLPEYPSNKSMQDRFIRDQAWTTLKQSTSQHDKEPEHDGVNVNLESLSQLETDMFDMSKVVGHAGNCQWGLDVGINQDGWSPYIHYSYGDVDRSRDDEEETKPGRCFEQDPYTIRWRAAKEQQDKADVKSGDPQKR
ncbi:hypothetical protein AAF712_009467 [Marasmius tenuissimus]|uniref:PHD-type domain-containing protein n=1 Tax=Marasmius tenuissimus TaxID=585030 RepID=A0ABR2ZQL8_9AGAR